MHHPPFLGLSILAVFACAMVAANILTGFTRIRAERIEAVWGDLR
jgi:hypothetical protein